MQKILSRRNFLHRIGYSTTAFLLACDAYSDTNQTLKVPTYRPNILLIISDDQGWGDASCNWDKTDIETPVMDEIANTGVRFTQFYVNPLCAPTRSSFFTGQYSMENGMWRGPSKENPGARSINSNITLLPEFLKNAGYKTGIFGKWHLGYQSPNVPNDRGFDEFYGFLGGAHPYTPAKANKLMHNRNRYHEDLHLTDYFTEKALSFIKKCAERKEPFFCYVPFNAVHGPLWLEERPRTSGRKDWLRLYDKKGIDFPRRDYNAVLSHMDNSVGRLLKLIRYLKLEENTLVIYCSDNGACLETAETKANYPGNNGPLRGGKGSTYDGGIRVPCVMRWKNRIPKGFVSDEIVMHFDIFSTILEVAGIDIPKMNGDNPIHGISLIKHILSEGEMPLPERTVFWELAGKVAVRKGEWKLVGQVETTRGNWNLLITKLRDTDLELYNLKNDISESINLREKYQAKYNELMKELIAFFKNIK